MKDLQTIYIYLKRNIFLNTKVKEKNFKCYFEYVILKPIKTGQDVT